jgi:nitrate/nitrite-specific signal transduction histidine kinase
MLSRSSRYLSCLLVIVSASMSLPAFALLTDAQAVNKAGLQRMLSQRIARNYIMVGANIDAQNAQKDLDQNVVTFEQNLMDLQEYATQKEVKAGVAKVYQGWSMYRMLAVSKPNKESAVEMLRASDELLQSSEDLVAQLQKATAKKTTKLIAVSGRQRMLSQRIAKLYISMYWTVPAQGLEAELNKAMQEYEKGLVLLEEEPLNTPQLNSALLNVRAQWDFSKAGYRQYKEGRFIPMVIAHTSDAMLKQMIDITAQYVQIVDRRVANK